MCHGVIRFRNFEYRSEEHCLYSNGRPVDIGSRALQILAALLERPGSYVSTNDLIEAGWPNTHVEESNLRVQMSRLRRQLGCSKNNVIIRNAPGRGYAFVGHLEHQATATTEPPTLHVKIDLTVHHGMSVQAVVGRLAPSLRKALVALEGEAWTGHATETTEGRR